MDVVLEKNDFNSSNDALNIDDESNENDVSDNNYNKKSTTSKQKKLNFSNMRASGESEMGGEYHHQGPKDQELSHE